MSDVRGKAKSYYPTSNLWHLTLAVETFNAAGAYHHSITRMNAQAFVWGNVAGASDGDLVAKAIAGREDGFEELVRRYQRPLVAYVYRMVGDYDAALDLTQEVFIKVYASL